jgi:hypothetical protein
LEREEITIVNPITNKKETVMAEKDSNGNIYITFSGARFVADGQVGEYTKWKPI